VTGADLLETLDRLADRRAVAYAAAAAAEHVLGSVEASPDPRPKEGLPVAREAIAAVRDWAAGGTTTAVACQQLAFEVMRLDCGARAVYRCVGSAAHVPGGHRMARLALTPSRDPGVRARQGARLAALPWDPSPVLETLRAEPAAVQVAWDQVAHLAELATLGDLYWAAREGSRWARRHLPGWGGPVPVAAAAAARAGGVDAIEIFRQASGLPANP